MLVKYNKSYEATYLQTAYEITGKINKQANKVETYFSLGENNRKLAEENTALKNRLPSNFINSDTTIKIVADSIKWDSTGKQRKYIYRLAHVINNSVSLQNNYITLERGKLQGINRGQAVVSAAGIVGIVVDASNNMAIVMSLLHRNSRTSVMLKKDLTNGILIWDGKTPNLLQLTGIPKSAKPEKGDTVLTSNISFNYPSGLMVGTIKKIEIEPGGNNYILQVQPGANFYSLQYVNVVENLFQQEQADLEAKYNGNIHIVGKKP